LAGIPLSIKHNFLTADMPTTASSRTLLNFHPHFDATAVRLLRHAAAHVVGKTNCDEFGMGSANVHSIYRPVINPASSSSGGGGEGGGASSARAPAKRQRVSGGSSGGSAASVASGSSALSLASDTGGSIRLPASYCGVWGFKPSYGRVSRWGLIAYADSLDTVGLLGAPEGLDHLIRAFEVLDKVDGRDPTAVSRALRERADRLVQARLEQIAASTTTETPEGGAPRLEGLIVGIPREYFPAELSRDVADCVRRVVRRLREKGAVVRSVSLPHTDRTLGAYYVLASAEAASNLARYDGIRYGFRKDGKPEDIANGEHPYAATRSEGFGDEVQRRILVGTYALSADAFDNYFLQAQKIRRLVQADFDRVFAMPNVLRRPTGSSTESMASDNQAAIENDIANEEKVDILIHPSAVGIAPLLPDPNDDNDSTPEEGRAAASYVQDVLTVPASLAGLPALSMPLGHGRPTDVEEAGSPSSSWPIGVSAVAQWGGEAMLWRVARALAAELP